jgi:hypothetical protein
VNRVQKAKVVALILLGIALFAIMAWIDGGVIADGMGRGL